MGNIDINWIAGFITEDPNIFCDDQVLMEVARPPNSYKLKQAARWLDPEKGRQNREVYRGLLAKSGTPKWDVNNKHAEVPQKWKDLDDDEKERHVNAEMGRRQEEAEMTIKQDPEAYKKISGKSEESEEGGKIDKADQAAVVTKATEKIKAAPGLSAALRQITTADKLAELLTTILISPQLGHLDNKRELQGLIQAKSTYKQLMGRAA